MYHKLILPSLLLFLSLSCHAQTNKRIGGPFENSEFMFIGMPENINASDTTEGWHEIGQKLIITGKILKADGITPAPGVILYYYQTDTEGFYADRQGLDPRVRRHGYLRGWVKSDATGNYAIHTIRPAAYPNRKDPAHIHPSIKEPGIDIPYYIDEFVFDDDPLLTTAKRKAMLNRGGSGILRLLQRGDVQIAEHNIILGLNIPNYPKEASNQLQSGRSVGEDLFSFTPYHAWGPDQGTTVCPICKYGRYQGVLYFVGENPDWEDIKKWLTYLERESSKRQQYLKAYFIYAYENESRKSTISKLEAIGQQLNLRKLALTIVPSFEDKASEIDLNAINPKAKNTFLIYRNSNIVSKFIDIEATNNSFKMISEALDKTESKFNQLSPPRHKE